MEYRDKSLVCVECHQQFVWTAGEQLFYADKNFKNEPKRCKECKGKGVVSCVVCKGSTPKCQNCKGSGNDPQTFSTCSTCGGKGSASVCYNCKGQVKKTCPSCGGAGSK